MLSEDVQISYRGFEPTQDVRTSLYYILNRLHLKSPSQSFLTATFTRAGEVFEGVIQVTSNVENFAVKASDVHLTKLTETLFSKLGQKLESWKALRFK
ncbi:MAG: hypothetical protein AB7F86_08310 [Bdellovibrionales bacterium]